ncbi:hypothetical protein [Devosia sediminis]|uniref:DUF883 domain-containing protein n=1 Tax=Devosia sediminis TaxID=2798801 RepID=A0A934IW90_9HYPH|nr:hypothetical protein [Devosia sediminis]MBJ3784256.1 hypothetical protein [Devosia sediminis]
MSLDTVLSQLGLRPSRPATLAEQIHALRRDIARMGRGVSHQVGHSAHDWSGQLSDFGQDAGRQAVQLAELAGSQARRGAEMVRRDPLPLIAVVGTGLLLARLLQRR